MEKYCIIYLNGTEQIAEIGQATTTEQLRAIVKKRTKDYTVIHFSIIDTLNIYL